MPENTSGGTTTSLNNTVQAKNDYFGAREDGIYCFDVMANDLGGNAKTLWSIDTTSDDGSTDLVARDVVGCADSSELGARIWLTADGKIAYDTSALDHLPAGQVVIDQFTYAIRLSNGTLSWATVTITLTGTNDVPVAIASSNSVLEDASISGNVSATDADAGETATLTYALVNPAPVGLTFNADGSYSFDASSYDSLPAGEELVLTIAFTASDATSTSAPANLVITITGTNDVPVASAAVNAVNEDASISGNVSATDADAGETATLVYALVDPAPEGLTFNADGSYSFDASSYDSLPAGEELVLTIAFTASDAISTSAPANLVITITGTNDVPVANAAVNAAVEDGPVINGSVTATDVDAGETATLTYALVDPAPVGLMFNADGSYSFDASSYDSLSAGEELVLTIPFTASDATSTSAPANLVITITGTNDVPVANAAVNAAVEDGPVINGSVTATDADAGETATLTYALVDPAPVGLTFNSDGSYAFDASSYDSLPAGEELVLTIPFTASDATSTSAPANLVITITGTNDVPVANAAVNAVNEDASIIGSVSATDADAGETATLTYALVDPAPAGLTFNADGSYSFDASSYDFLPAGEELVLTIPFTASDATSTSAPANLVITITGTNDVPVANAAVNAVNEDASISGSVSATDADAGETAGLTYALVDPAPAGLTFNADGSYSFDASSYDSLPAGEELVLIIPFTASDATSTSAPANLVITITGTNDAPALTAAQAVLAEGAEDTAYIVSAADLLAGFSDVDGDTLSVANLTASDGTIEDNGDGTYTITPTANFNGPVTLSYDVVDGHGGSVAANLGYVLAAVNDAPELTGDQAVLADGTEDEPYIVSAADLLAGWSDVDGDTLVAFALTADHGSVFDNGDGTYTITPAADYNGPVELHYYVSDGTDDVPASLTFELAPVDDLPPETRVNDPADDMDFDDPSLISAFNGATVQTGNFNGSGSSDVILGNGSGQTLNGLNGGDSIHGAGGNDTINGNNQNDTLYGGAGNDTINGGGGADTIYGGSGNDSISGDGDLDIIRGGSGDDVIRGGGFGDQLWGGTGQDDFVIGLGDTGFGSLRDTINDFSHAEGDIIDLTGYTNFAGADWAGEIGDQSELAAGQIGYVTDLDGSVTVFGDHDGDGDADFRLEVIGVNSLQASDLLFGS